MSDTIENKIDDVPTEDTNTSDNPQSGTEEQVVPTVNPNQAQTTDTDTIVENEEPIRAGEYGDYEIEIQQPEEKSETETPVVESQEQKTTNIPVERPKPLSNEEVTGHTANLWKYIAIPENEPEPFPEYINGTVEFPGSKVIAARVRGKKHKHEGTNCDDWYETANYDKITFVAVSDGAGSKKFSRIGAKESCTLAHGVWRVAAASNLPLHRMSYATPKYYHTKNTIASLFMRIYAVFYAFHITSVYSIHPKDWCPCALYFVKLLINFLNSFKAYKSLLYII